MTWRGEVLKMFNYVQMKEAGSWREKNMVDKFRHLSYFD
jgi:hypothetical protein